MTQDTLRLGFFLGGLLTLLSWELAAPHHAPTVSRGRRWLANLSLAAINGAVVSGLCVLCYTLATQRTAPWRVGLFEVLPLPSPVRWTLEVLVLDLVAYALHRLYHRVPLFWRFHQVHHTDLDLDVTSASRFHLGEVATSAAAKLALVQLLGISTAGLIAFEIALLVAAQFQHANVRLPARGERWLWWSFVPPAMHRIHHRPVAEDMGSNYGTLVTLWDRLFGSLRRTDETTPDFGLPALRRPEDLGPVRLVRLPFAGRDPGGVP